MTGQTLLNEDTPHGQVRVTQQGELRSLWLDDGLLQSEIDLQHPERLPNPVSRAMLAHLLFYSRPRRVLLAGCGGGGIARWFHARAPSVVGVALELSPRVAELAVSHFDFPGADSRWELRVADVRRPSPADDGEFDFILVDIAEQGLTPDWVSGEDFLHLCRDRLSAHGVLTVNFIPADAGAFADALYRLREVFDRRSVCMTVPGRGNVMVMGFRGCPDLARTEAQLAETRRRWGLEFDEFLARMRRENPPDSGVF
jgi:spermidine synthase